MNCRVEELKLKLQATVAKRGWDGEKGGEPVMTKMLRKGKAGRNLGFRSTITTAFGFQAVFFLIVPPNS